MTGEAFSDMDKEGGRIGSGAVGSGRGGLTRCGGTPDRASSLRP